MQYIEDAIEQMYRALMDYRVPQTVTASREGRFISDMFFRVAQKRRMSTEQSKAVCRALKTFRHLLVDQGLATEAEIDALLVAPQHRQKPYQSRKVPREVRYAGDNRLAFRFKLDPAVRDALKSMHATELFEADRPQYSWDHQCWLVAVTRDTLPSIAKVISEHRFQFDDAVGEYLTLAANSEKLPSAFEYDPESGMAVANVTDNPLLASWIKKVLGVTPL